MSSNPPKQSPKMCKSPKAINFQQCKPDKIVLNEYENLSTNCTTVGSNNLHLVKKPQLMTNMSPAYSNPSPGYPHSPYNSPVGLKSPSPQHMKPPTPQPTSFPVMQIIHNNHPLLARQTSQSQNIIKLKPHLNILPKPSASPQPSPKPSVSPQIVIPTNQQATIMPTAQPLLLNQMPVLTTPGVQFILRPQAAKIPAQMQTGTPQGLILQPSSQPLLHYQPPRSQPLVRVLTNGMQLAPPTTTYVTHLANNPQGNQTITQNSLVQQTQPSPPKKKPKKKKQKLDLANIMKLSGIGDEDDIQFESDTSQSETEPTSVHSFPNTPQPQQNVILPQHNLIQSQQNIVQTHLQSSDSKKMGNIQISTVPQPTINATNTPLVQVLNQSFQGIPTSQAATAQASIPFNPFITPNFTINNGLMVQRSGGFKLTLGEDGRLILQHDPTLNQDLQSQILLQSIFGLNGGLVLQPSMDQQVHSQTVQTIQQQSVQTIQQQTVQSQTIQTVQQQTVQPQSVQHSLQTIQQTIQPQIQTVQPQTMQQTVQQTIQHQTVQSQPLAALQQHTQPMQIVQPQPIQNLNQSIQSQTVHSIQSQVQPTLHSIQSQIQGQIQSLLQSQLHSQNMSQAQTLPIQTVQSQSIQTVQSQPLIVHSQPMQITHTVQSQPLQPIQTQATCSQPLQAIHSQPLHTVQSRSLQTVPSQAIQTQSQPVQTIQSQPMLHSHAIQSHPLHTAQSQPVLKVQPFQKSQPPVQTVHPQPIQTIHHQPNQSNLSESQPHNVPPTSYVVNLTPDQLEQLKRNGQLTVNGQTIFMQRPNANKTHEVTAGGDNKVKLSPKIKPVKKVNKMGSIKSVLQDNGSIKSVDKALSTVKEMKSSLVTALQSPPKHILANNHVQVQPQQPLQPILQKPTSQPSALVQPSVQTATTNSQVPQSKIPIQQPKVQVLPNVQQSQPQQTAQNHVTPESIAPPNQDVDRLLGQIIEESGSTPQGGASTQNHGTQRVHTIQLTSQKQQHLKSIQLQIQTLSARLTPGDTEMQNALKLLFQEQQKILATGKLLPPDKVYYHNNQLTIVNPSGLTPIQSKSELPTTGQTVVRSTTGDAPSSRQVAATQTSKVTVAITESNVPVSQSNNTCQPSHVQSVCPRLTVPAPVPSAVPPSSQQHRFLPTFTKAQLIEQQLNTDQNGAIKPDVYTPFRDKTDACKRLIRYHCFDQHVLSQKDLNKADEIFEMTAKHFIDKFSKMVDKYRFLRLKESQRQVQTSELMMLDRMFLAEEQQSLIRLRQESQEQPIIEITPPPSQAPQLSTDTAQQEEYDEWACIQRELGCLPVSEECRSPHPQEHQAAKRSASSDSRLETLKKFRVEKHHKKGSDCSANSVNAGLGVNTVNAAHAPACGQDAQLSPATHVLHCVRNTQGAQITVRGNHGLSPLQSSRSNSPHGSQQCSPQSVHTLSPHSQPTSQHSVLNSVQSGHGVQQMHVPLQGATGAQHPAMTHGMHMPHISSQHGVPSMHNAQNSQQMHTVQNSHQGSQNSQQNIQNSQHGVQNSHHSVQNSSHTVQNSQHMQNSNLQHGVQNSQRSAQGSQQHGRQVTHIHNASVHSAQQNSLSAQQRLHNAQTHHSQNIHNMQHFSHSTQHIVQSTMHATQHITHTVHHTQHIHNTQHSVHNSQHSVHQQNVNAHNVHSSYNVQTHSNAQHSDGTDNIIDEQVQSAIDSILNLQQSSLDLDDAVNSILS